MGEKMTGIDRLMKLRVNSKQAEQISASNDIKTERMLEFAGEEKKTERMPEFVGEEKKTERMPEFVGEEKKTERMPEFAGEEKKTERMPEFAGEETQIKRMRKLRKGQEEQQNDGMILVNETGDRHYKGIGEFSRQGGTANIYSVECLESNKRYVAKIYSEKEDNRHIDNFCNDVRLTEADGFMEICDRGYKEEQEFGRVIKKRFYILQDYSGTTNLMEYLGNYILSENQIIEFIKNVIETLHIMHMKGYYHRDIKPDNILYDDNLRRPIIIDYGSVTFAKLGISDVTRTGNDKRTPGYTPPEYFESRGESSGMEVEASPKYDFFQLGVVLGDIYCSMYAGKADRFFKTDNEALTTCRYAKFKFPPNLEKNYRMINLIKALLRHNPVDRAGYEEVKKWLKGDILDVDRPSENDMQPQFMYSFASKIYYTEEKLARAMAVNWERGCIELQRGRLRETYEIKLGIEYKNMADKISDIENDYKEISVDISKHASLLETISLLGKNMAFCWKGRIYEKSDGTTDYSAIAEDLYTDAKSGTNYFDELVLSRSVKELLYPQIRFLDDCSLKKDKETVKYDECMASVKYLNKMAEHSVQLAKFYLAELCYEKNTPEGMESYIISEVSDGKTNDINKFLTDTFSSENIDSAMKIVHNADGQNNTPVLLFLDDYKKSERLKACLMKFYDFSYNDLDEIKLNCSRTEQIIRIIYLLSLCEENDSRYEIKNVFAQTCYVNIIYKYIKQKDNWKFINTGKSELTEEYKNKLDAVCLELSEALKDIEDFEVFRNKLLTALCKAENLIQTILKVFVYDRRLIDSGLILCTKKEGEDIFINNAIISKSDAYNMCIVDEKFIVPKCVAERYCKGKISVPKIQKEIEKQSIDMTYKYVKSFNNSFRNIVGKEVDQLIKQSKKKLFFNFIVAFIVLLLGSSLFISGGKLFVTKEFNKVYILALMVIDFVLGSIFLLRYTKDLKNACHNIKIYIKNIELTKRVKLIDTLENKLVSMRKNGSLRKLSSREKEIIQNAGTTGNSARMYIQKHNLTCGDSSYRKIRAVSLYFVSIIGLLLLLFNHIPAKNIFVNILENNISQAVLYSESRESLPNVMQSIDKMVTCGVLYVTESYVKTNLIGEYNLKELDDKKFRAKRKDYYSICKKAGYRLHEEVKKTLDNIEFSKSEYAKGAKIQLAGSNSQKDKDKIALHYINVIPEDGNYINAHEFLLDYLKELYKKQQKYIKNNQAKELDKLTKKYSKLLKGKVVNPELNDIYNILNNKKSSIEQKAKELVALQLHYKGEDWDDEGFSNISCEKCDIGRYYVKVQKKNSGLERLFAKYRTEEYVFTTYMYEIGGVPDDIKFNMQDFDPDISQEEYLKILE